MNTSFASLTEFRSLLRAMPACDDAAMAEARAHDAMLTKPPGALGRLEDLAVWYRGWRGGARAEIAAWRRSLKVEADTTSGSWRTVESAWSPG